MSITVIAIKASHVAVGMEDEAPYSLVNGLGRYGYRACSGVSLIRLTLQKIPTGARMYIHSLSVSVAVKECHTRSSESGNEDPYRSDFKALYID
jgi:hypothetical protein